MAEGQDFCLVGNPVADQLDAGQAAHGVRLDQGTENAEGSGRARQASNSMANAAWR